MSATEPVFKALLNSLPQIGEVTWIGLRPDQKTPTKEVDSVLANSVDGLVGDRYKSSQSKRQVTLIQEEHFLVVSAILGKEVAKTQVRRNIAVKGINLLSLHNRRFALGDVILEGTGYCYPCSKMESALGPGGYNAMRGHGGITAKVIKDGEIKIGNPVSLISE